MCLEVKPAVMVIVAGTVPTDWLLLPERLTMNPAVGAGANSGRIALGDLQSSVAL